MTITIFSVENWESNLPFLPLNDLDVKRLNQILKNIQKTIDNLTKMWYNNIVIKEETKWNLLIKIN